MIKRTSSVSNQSLKWRWSTTFSWDGPHLSWMWEKGSAWGSHMWGLIDYRYDIGGSDAIPVGHPQERRPPESPCFSAGWAWNSRRTHLRFRTTVECRIIRSSWRSESYYSLIQIEYHVDISSNTSVITWYPMYLH